MNKRTSMPAGKSLMQHCHLFVAPYKLILLLVGFCIPNAVLSQQKKTRVSFKDSLDRKPDLSDWIIEANGFIPVPIIITEPALGNFGIGVAPVFLKRRPPMSSDGKAYPVPPDITAGAAAFTANKTWFAGGGRMASIPRYRLRYKVAAAYANVNLSFYRNLNNLGDRAYAINGKTLVGFGYLARQLKNPDWVIGIQYLFMNVKLSMQNDSSLPSFIKQDEYRSNIGEVGIVSEFDNRDNIFTPDKGLKAHIHVNFSENYFGSDYRYQRLNSFLYWYQPIFRNSQNGKNWISGARFDYQQMFGDPPFFLLPYINMRGIPTVRYQGKTNILIETEQRWDFQRRWSAVFFGGLAKAFDNYNEFGDAELLYNYGAGFRYLIARKFKLRMGLDIARGPGSWAYYIIFGTSWLK